MKTAKPATSVKSVKPVASETPVTPTSSDTAIRVLKTGTCPSLSGKSNLEYKIGCSGKSEIQFRISANSGGGFFSDDWISLSDIQEELDKVPSGKPITSFSLSPLFKGQSANSPGFLFATLKQEGLVQALKDKARSYERGDVRGFMAGIKALVALDGKPEGKQPKPEGKAKATPSKPAAPAKKTASKPSAKKKA